MVQVLLDRFQSQGTLSHPNGIPNPAFSLPGTLNWMRALAILIEEEPISIESLSLFYSQLPEGDLSSQCTNTVFEQLLLSFHNLSSLEALGTLDKPIDTVRSAISAWYSGILSAASAMIAAQSGTIHSNADQTADAWTQFLSGQLLVPAPFDYHVTTLVKKDTDNEVAAFRGENPFELNDEPIEADQAFGACMAYLKGTSDWMRKRIEDELRVLELPKLNVDNFRTKDAKKMRDAKLQGNRLGFVHQAIRYNGKANDREALFLCYGSGTESSLDYLHSDLQTVLTAFLQVAAAFCSVKIGADLWNVFCADVRSNVHLSTQPSSVWTEI